MRLHGRFGFIGFALWTSIGLVACSQASGEGGGGVPSNNNASSTSGGNGGPVTDKPEPFPQGTGQSANATVPYPSGPFGVNKGSVIQNYKFMGFPNATVDSHDLVTVELADFYNPTGKDTFPKGSPLGDGTPKPKALLIDVASVWCGPCNYEAANVLPGLYAKYKPMGGEFLLQLADGPTPGTAASSKNLYQWTKKYKVNYPATIDPSYKLSALFQADAFPANMIIDTKTMKIVDVIAGVPDDGGSFWPSYEKLLQ
jgi:hypothetical protein